MIKIAKSLIILCCLVSLHGCYLLEQTSGQMDLRYNQVELGEAIQQEKNSDIKKLLIEVASIKQFAEKHLLLEKTENYTGYYHTDQPGITFVVTASPKDKLEPKTWWFPIIGSVPYKGYFNKEDALALEQELQSEGYDTWLFAAPAYSSLGWFKDPITTPMLKKGLYYLTDTIIHEMVHVTLYIDDQGDFNEQLAAFVALKGASEYIKSKSDGDKIITAQKRRQASYFQKNRILQKYLKKLQQLYSEKNDLAVTMSKRDQIFNELTATLLKKYPDSKPEYWKYNNARILQYKRYQPKSEIFNKIWLQSNDSWETFWQLIDNHIKQKNWE